MKIFTKLTSYRYLKFSIYLSKINFSEARNVLVDLHLYITYINLVLVDKYHNDIYILLV